MTHETPQPTVRTPFWIVFVGLLLGATTLAYPYTTRDSATAAYIGRTLLEGGAPYRDAWNVKGPGIYFIHALSQLVFGPGVTGLNLFCALWQVLTALLVTEIARRAFTSTLAAAAAGLMYLGILYAQHYACYSEPDALLSLFLALAFLSAWLALERGGYIWWITAAACVGVAILFKLPLGLFGVLLMLAATRGARRAPGSALARLAALAGGVLLPISICGLFLHARGAWQDYLVSQFVVAPQMVRVLHSLGFARHVLPRLFYPSMIPYYAAGLLGVVAVRGKWPGWPGKPATSFAIPALTGWLGIAVLTVVAHGVYLNYHFLPLAAPLSILAGQGLACRWDALGDTRPRARLALAAALALFVLFPLAQTVRNVRATAGASGATRLTPPFASLGTYLAAHSSPRDRIYIWGDAVVIYLYADRKSSSRFLSSYFLSIPWRGTDFQGTFLNEIQAEPPVFFVRLHGQGLLPALAPQEARAFAQFTGLQQLLARDYHVCGQRPEYDLYARAPRTCPPAEGMP